MSTHNICFHGGIRKNILWITPSLISGGNCNRVVKKLPMNFLVIEHL